jgi:hypothetical protein
MTQLKCTEEINQKGKEPRMLFQSKGNQKERKTECQVYQSTRQEGGRNINILTF